ncbi:MAG TPA: PAS domain S-box protein [Verrucomicrobiae bacterium]|nr:PAS domain S-box protein [Verrucomicrobiae bacterium]
MADNLLFRTHPHMNANRVKLLLPWIIKGVRDWWFDHVLGPVKSNLPRIFAFNILYVVSGILGKAILFSSGQIALVWPPSAIALAALLLFGCGFWLWLVPGAIFLAFTDSQPVGFFTATSAVGNIAVPVLCTLLLQRLGKFETSLSRLKDVILYVFVACLAGGAVTGLFNVLGSRLWEGGSFANIIFAVLSHWVPNSIACLIIAPFVLSWCSPDSERLTPSQLLECFICSVGLFIATFISFNSWYSPGLENFPLAYLPYPFLLWGALRFGPRGASAGTLLVSIMAINELLEGRGPFYTGAEKQSLMLIGSYITTLATSNLLLAGAATERKHAQRTISQGEERYRGIVTDQSQLVCRFQVDGKLTFVNEAYCQFYGKTREQLLGTPFLPFIEAEQRQITLNYFESLPPEDPVISYDIKMLSVDGDSIWQRCTLRRLLDENKATLEFQAVMQDISDRKQIEERLRKSEEVFQIVANNISDLIAVTDEEGKRSFNSRSYQPLLGEPESLVGSYAFDQIHPEDRERMKQVFRETLRTGVGRRVQFRFLMNNGTVRYLESQGFYVSGEHGRPGQVITISRDITERRQLETEIRHAKEVAETAIRTRAKLVGSLSGELRTQLDLIVGVAETMLKEAVLEQHADQARTILDTARRLLTNVEDLTTESTAEGASGELTRTAFQLPPILNELQNSHKALTTEKQIRFLVESQSSLPELFADQLKFKSVLQTLVGAAFQFAGQGGRVVLQAGLPRDVQPSETRRHLRISLVATQDEAPENAPAVFTPDAPEVIAAPTRKLVDLHHGRVRSETAPDGKRRAFHLEMPVDLRQAPASADEDVLKPLVVMIGPRPDENLRRFLLEAGYDVKPLSEDVDVPVHVKSLSPYAVAVAPDCAWHKRSVIVQQLGQHSNSSRMPVVIVTRDDNSNLEFQLALPDENLDGVPRRRFCDAVLQRDGLGEQEVKRVMVVDDEPLMVQLLTRISQHRGFQVLQAHDGDQAIRHAFKHPVDLVILDLKMAGTSGFEVVTKLKEHRKTQEVPILVHTGINLSDEDKKRLTYDSVLVSSKFNRECLFEQFDRILRGERACTALS